MGSWIAQPVPVRRLLAVPVIALVCLAFFVIRSRATEVVERSNTSGTVVASEPAAVAGLLIVTVRVDPGKEVKVLAESHRSPAAGERVPLVRLRQRDGTERYLLGSEASALGEVVPCATK